MSAPRSHHEVFHAPPLHQGRPLRGRLPLARRGDSPDRRAAAGRLPAASAAGSLPASNPLAVPSNLPFDAPRFDLIKDTDFQPALDAGMAQLKAETDAIADNPAPPTFDNTITALEKAGQLLTRANALFGNLTASNTSDVLDKVNQAEAPRLQALIDSIQLDPKLFARVKTLYDARDTLGLTADQNFLLERYYRRFVHAGAELSPADKAAAERHQRQDRHAAGAVSEPASGRGQRQRGRGARQGRAGRPFRGADRRGGRRGQGAPAGRPMGDRR